MLPGIREGPPSPRPSPPGEGATALRWSPLALEKELRRDDFPPLPVERAGVRVSVPLSWSETNYGHCSSSSLVTSTATNVQPTEMISDGTRDSSVWPQNTNRLCDFDFCGCYTVRMRSDGELLHRYAEAKSEE